MNNYTETLRKKFRLLVAGLKITTPACRKLHKCKLVLIGLQIINSKVKINGRQGETEQTELNGGTPLNSVPQVTPLLFLGRICLRKDSKIS